MKRTTKLLLLMATVTVTITGVAIAASSPTVSSGPAIRIGQTAAKLEANVNPNGSPTTYVFQYGLTSTYGTSTPSHSAGHGTKPVVVGAAVEGLTPGTVYHYRVSASNHVGGAFGNDRAFRTTGHLPASVVTGAATGVGRTVATVTGSVDPQGQTTTWIVRYGLTTSYGVQTFPQTLAAVSSSLPVSLKLDGLAPATMFHYQIVAYHGARVVSAGADETFFTRPEVRPKPRLAAHTVPRHARKRPYLFTTTGTLRGGDFIPPALRCSGHVGVRYYAGSRQVAFVIATVNPNCQFAIQAKLRRLSGSTVTPIRVAIHFRGNGYLAPADHTNHVTAG